MFLKLGPNTRELSIGALIPNLLTTLALCSGLAALHFALKPDIPKAMAAVVFSGIFDALDGRAARLLKVSSPFGAILDSLSDFLGFGVAPAMILHRWMLGTQGAAGLAAVMIYALCAALRLARFTAAATPAKPHAVDRHFVGMPSPSAAGAVLIAPMLAHADPPFNWNAPPLFVTVFTFAIGVLMLTRLPMFSLKALRLSRRAVAPVLIGVAVGVVGIVKNPWLTISIISALYLASIPITVTLALLRRSRQPDAGDTPAPTRT